MDLNEYYRVLAKQANPDASDEDINSQLSSVPADRLKAAMSPLGLPETPSASDFDVNVSDDTVKMNGRPDSLPSASDIPGTSPAPAPVEPTPAPVTPTPDQTPPTVDATAPSLPQAAPKSGADALLPSESQMTQDNDARKAMLEAENKKRMLGGLASFGAGVGDAITNASSAFGTNAHSNAQAGVEKALNEQEAQHKEQFEAGLKNDPNSDISKHYQKVLGLMMGKHPDDPSLTKMSAATIAQTLPEVEKYMAKELGLKQIQSNKELQMSMHEQGRQDKLEKETREWVDNLAKARNGQVGQQDSKVNMSVHLLNLMDQYKDQHGNYKVPNSQYEELALGLANLVSPTGTASEHVVNELRQRTGKGDLNGALTYLGFDPKTLGGSTQSVFENLRHSIERQGTVSEDLRNKYLADQKDTAPSGLNAQQSQRLLSKTFGNSVKDYIASNPANHPKMNAGAVPTVQSQQDYDRLPTGASYQGPDGKTYRKK